MLLPLVLGFGLACQYLPESDIKVAESLFLGIALAITALPVTVKALMDFGQLNSRVGQMIVSAAMIDDTVGLILLAVLTGLIGAEAAPDIENSG